MPDDGALCQCPSQDKPDGLEGSGRGQEGAHASEQQRQDAQQKQVKEIHRSKHHGVCELPKGVEREVPRRFARPILLAAMCLRFIKVGLGAGCEPAKINDFKNQHGKSAEKAHAEDDEHGPKRKDDSSTDRTAGQGIQAQVPERRVWQTPEADAESRSRREP